MENGDECKGSHIQTPCVSGVCRCDGRFSLRIRYRCHQRRRTADPAALEAFPCSSRLGDEQCAVGNGPWCVFRRTHHRLARAQAHPFLGGCVLFRFSRLEWACRRTMGLDVRTFHRRRRSRRILHSRPCVHCGDRASCASRSAGWALSVQHSPWHGGVAVREPGPWVCGSW